MSEPDKLFTAAEMEAEYRRHYEGSDRTPALRRKPTIKSKPKLRKESVDFQPGPLGGDMHGWATLKEHWEMTPAQLGARNEMWKVDERTGVWFKLENHDPSGKGRGPWTLEIQQSGLGLSYHPYVRGHLMGSFKNRTEARKMVRFLAGWIEDERLRETGKPRAKKNPSSKKKSLKSRAKRAARTDAGRAGIGGGIGALALGPIGAVAGAVIGIGTKKNPALTHEELKDKIWSWLQKTEGPGGKLSYDAGVQTQAEWATRGEEYNNEAAVVIWFEGPLYHALNYGFEETPAFRTEKKFTKFLAGLGYYYELGNAWNAGIFPL